MQTSILKPVHIRTQRTPTRGSGQLSRYSDSLQAGRSEDRIPVGARFSAPIQTGLEAHPASDAMGTGSFPGESSRGVALTTHPIHRRG
jgi:hypothetical protein